MRSAARDPGWRAGIALAALYGAAAVGYVAAGGRVQPLFDGFAPPPPYRWVAPPRELARGNEPPGPSRFEVALGPAGSVQAGGSSDDGQAILSFAAGAVPPRPGDERVSVQVTPLDPATLGPLPPGLVPVGNAYRVEMVAQPSGQPVEALAAPADAFLVVPEPARTLLFSPSGQSWEAMPPRPVPDRTQVAGRLARPGYLVGAAPPSARPPRSGGDQGAPALVRVGAVTLALTALLVGAPAAGRRLRRRSRP